MVIDDIDVFLCKRQLHVSDSRMYRFLGVDRVLQGQHGWISLIMMNLF